MKTIRIGLIGAGANARARHIPKLQVLPGVELLAVCNRRPTSTAAVASAYGIPRSYRQWEEVVADPDIDAVVIGTWPYLHCPVTLAALKAGKHVLTEARMAMNAAEAHEMWQAATLHPGLVCQIVPSPFGLRANRWVKQLIDTGFLGDLREVAVVARNNALGDSAAPLSWRQDAGLSGYNMLTLGIVHETVLRWAPPPVRVVAQVHAFLPERTDPESGVRRAVGTPDSVQVLAVLENGARATYQLSGVTSHGQEMAVTLFGSEGVLYYDLLRDRLTGASRREGRADAPAADLQELPAPAHLEGGWRVEEDFLASIREGCPVELTDFATGVAYMEFTEAVARSAEDGAAVALPLAEFSPEDEAEEEL